MEKDIVKKFFLSSVISDDQRKELWIKKIGNRIKINKTLYSNLIERLQHEGVPQKIDKLIRDDLDRTLPSDSQTIKGSHVYEHIKNILKIWHLYRPDIGYTQGMAYYVCLLYTYYDEYMTFKQFSNLVVGNELIFSFYNFDKIKVSFFLLISSFNCTDSFLNGLSKGMIVNSTSIYSTLISALRLSFLTGSLHYTPDLLTQKQLGNQF